ncbi:hypothetical protein GOP47_0007362 [Adiantum capillus-veneris]|uniref:Pre-mRNA-splicing factor SLU7 n=1 Tax=Adiantum capillus-veneris TaxID=13818 RepID=A0A9D4V1F0_ADICA|nr:hypothetical protein GOP47_0007362 [Adiantum capillus-veneris]
MREDPLPDVDPNDGFYRGDNQNRTSGQAQEFKWLTIHSWEAYAKGQDIHMQAAPSQAELLYKEFTIEKERLKGQLKKDIIEKYGNAASEDKPPMELLLGQTGKQMEYDRAGRVIRGQGKAVPKSKYEEDVFINNHTSAWGSWWKDGKWGYKCCKQMIWNSYCTGSAGIEAAEASVELMKANLARKDSLPTAPVVQEEKTLAMWGTETSNEELNLDPKLLKEALKRQDEKKREERDERKRKYNVTWNDQVTVEDMEAYRMKKVHFDDPMKDFLH